MLTLLRPSSPLARRLYPLYLAVFLQGWVLWYAIEKAFMLEVGFTYATMGVMAAAYSGMTFLLETPSGILADRWSRKGVAILAGLCLTISSLVCGLSESVGMYILGTVFWGVFFAFYSGTYDSMVYDTLLEEKDDANDYTQYFGWVRIFDGAALVASALLGGVMAAAWGLEATYFWSIPAGVLSMVALLYFREPKLHKAEAAEPLLRHIQSTFGAILKRGVLVRILIVLVLGGLLAELITEFNQLWWIAIAAPVMLFGVATAPILASYGISGVVAPLLRLQSRAFVTGLCALLLGASLTLVFARDLWLIVTAQSTIAICLLAIDVIYLTRLHDRLPSRVRAGASSAVSTMVRIVFMGTSLAFGWISNRLGIFDASWLIVVLLAGLCVVLLTSTTNQAADEHSNATPEPRAPRAASAP